MPVYLPVSGSVSGCTRAYVYKFVCKCVCVCVCVCVVCLGGKLGGVLNWCLCFDLVLRGAVAWPTLFIYLFIDLPWQNIRGSQNFSMSSQACIFRDLGFRV
jgi:hypothetical protein